MVDMQRHARHLVLPQVGIVGQEKLAKAKVFVVGAGGLGSPVLLYLAAAGVGTIGVIDDDLVDISNLQRQVLHRTEDVGRMKVDSAKEQLLALDPNLNIVEHKERLSPENALEVFKGWDVVVDGTDNIPTRYLIDDACHLLSIPWVYGSIHRFEGQVSFFSSKENRRYRDLFPEAPPQERCKTVLKRVCLVFFQALSVVFRRRRSSNTLLEWDRVSSGASSCTMQSQ